MSRTPLLALVAAAAVFSAPLRAQMPKGIYAWWSNPVVVNGLNLSPEQRRQIRSTVQEYRPHLLELRATLNEAEEALQAEFDRDPVDAQKANQAVERLVRARSDLTRTLSQMSLKLRAALTEPQWRELQRNRPSKARAGEPAGR